ncbi:dienelactone hydrolase family protein [Paraburkholderia pallida]|uniref:Dienelactone hydrolase family protein n=1 Tax=Paraburkholderia pallida TaxID=2547399 RepID=A0A4P7D0I0_9BURK|nr:dienelactone hydrolase family protein [Paraburkholderia pallida]QBR02141.1 dienelactone hydrolase family protein [Paraburkholderia pallida]
MASSVEVLVPDGTFYAYLAEPVSVPAPAVVVVQEAFGVNADLRMTCDELASKGFIAVSPDLYWRQQPRVELSDKTDWPQALALYAALDLDKAVSDLQATIEQARAMTWCTGRVGVVGFCLGGLLAYLVAARVGVDAGVGYYGARTDEFLGEARAVRGPLLMHFGDQDESIGPAAQKAIRDRLTPLGVEIRTYVGCSHAFARHDGAHFDAGAAAKASVRTVEFLNQHLFE